ncbi:MAG: hypothetical protein AAB074_19010 [Planctomycetota bacterium]
MNPEIQIVVTCISILVMPFAALRAIEWFEAWQLRRRGSATHDKSRPA